MAGNEKQMMPTYHLLAHLFISSTARCNSRPGQFVRLVGSTTHSRYIAPSVWPLPPLSELSTSIIQCLNQWCCYKQKVNDCLSQEYTYSFVGKHTTNPHTHTRCRCRCPARFEWAQPFPFSFKRVVRIYFFVSWPGCLLFR